MSVSVVSRREWGARPWVNDPTANPIGHDSCVFLHHSEFPTLPKSATKEQEIARMRQIESVHMDGRGWSAIAYSYIIFPSGRIYTGRGFSKVPASQIGYNTGNGSICFDGRYDSSKTTWNQRLAAIRLIRARFGGSLLGIHKDVNDTSCPGANVASVASRIATLAGMKRWA